MVVSRAIDTAFHAHLVVLGRDRHLHRHGHPWLRQLWNQAAWAKLSPASGYRREAKLGARRGYNRACSLWASNRCRLRVSRPSLTVSPGPTFIFGSTRAVTESPPTCPYRNWSEPRRSTTSTFISMVLPPSTARSVTASGRKPSVPFPAGTDFGSLTSKPAALAVLSKVVTGTKFMVGLPMKPATKRLAGWS